MQVSPSFFTFRCINCTYTLSQKIGEPNILVFGKSNQNDTQTDCCFLYTTAVNLNFKIALLRTCTLIKKKYIHHVSAKTMTTGRIIPSGTNSPPVKESPRDSNKYRSNLRHTTFIRYAKSQKIGKPNYSYFF